MAQIMGPKQRLGVAPQLLRDATWSRDMVVGCVAASDGCSLRTIQLKSVFQKSEQSSEFSLESFFQHLIPQLAEAAARGLENFVEGRAGAFHVFSWGLLPKALASVGGVVSPVKMGIYV